MEKEKILNQKIKENSKIVEDIVFEIVKAFTEPLDNIMRICRNMFNSGVPMNDMELEDLLLQLPSTLYFTGEGQELVGIREDVSNMAKKEIYNEVRQKAIGTINDKNTEAEAQSLNEALNEVIYQRAYKMIRGKIEMGCEMLNSLKRINDKRRMDYQIGNGARR